MGDPVDVYGAVGIKAASEALDRYLVSKDVDAETREMIRNSLEMMLEYMPYAISQGKDPTDRRLFAEFLAKKGLYIEKYAANDKIKCGISVAEFLMSAKTAAGSSSALPLAVAAWGVAFLDLIEIGNSCEFAQRAYYQTFLKQSSARLAPVRRRVNIGYEQNSGRP